MPKLNELYPSRYLKAADIKGKEPIVTIRSCEVEELGMGDDKETKPVLYFEKATKGLALNATNANTIALLLDSDDTDLWIGKRIKLVVEVVSFRGKAVEAIRVKAAGPAKSGPAPKQEPTLSDEDTHKTPANDDDIPW